MRSLLPFPDAALDPATGEPRFGSYRGGRAVEAHVGGLELDARIEAGRAPPAITAIAPLGPGLFDVTEKRTTAGEPIAANLVQGFAGEAECAVWLGGEVFPLGEGRIAFGSEPLNPWTVTDGGRADLRFDPGATHVERRQLGVASSRFVHPIGAYSGSIDVAGRRVTLGTALGVTEDQDVTW